MNDKQIKFREELNSEVKRIKRECLKDGTVALGFDCLFAHLNFRNLPSAPLGTNAVYFVKQELREVAKLHGKFILQN